MTGTGPMPHLTAVPPEYHAWEPVPACAVCGSADREVVDLVSAVVRCAACGHRFVDPRPTMDEIIRGYSMPASYDGWLAAEPARRAMWGRRFERALGRSSPGRLLDVSAGIGTFLAIARDRGWTVEGTEVSSTAVEKARELYDIEVRHGTVEGAAPPGPYDVICLWHVLEHLPDPAGSLRVCRGLLGERGRLVLAMPNDDDAAWALTAAGNQLRRGLGRAPSRRYERLRPGVESHIQHFTPGSIRRLLASCDFAVDEIDVDDASPERTRVGRAAYLARRTFTRVTPWNVGHEMLVLARPA